MTNIEVMDTTLRDGEQTTGVSFSEAEKLAIARLLLEEIKVDRIEVASARVSDGEFRSVKRITDWAKKNNCIERVEILGFVDQTVSLDWIAEAGGKVINLLTKGSLKHLQGQLRKTPEQHAADIQFVIDEAEKRGITVNVYLEDWSNGMLSSREYVYFMVDFLSKAKVRRIMLPDTLGILNPEQTYEFCKDMYDRYPGVHFDFHAHNDYDFSVANVFMALKAGMKGLHTTVNGLGERAGNAPLASVLGMMNDHLKLQNSLNESKLTKVSKMVESFSGVRIPANKPLTGEYVFTQCSGVHADGDNKDNLYFNELMPERFGRVRRYALGKTSGKANIKKNLEELGIELNAEDMKKVTQRVIDLGDKKETVTTEDLPYIISDVLKNKETPENIKLLNYSLSLVRKMKPVASIRIQIHNKTYAETSIGDGQYDAFMKALWKIYESLNLDHPVLTDYWVSIPPGGKTDALVETVITWDFKGQEFKTRGLDADQTEAAIKATLKMLNIIESDEVRFKG
ncbi:alpha-isopropylmalate synthase regulatory domain-containing protein [Alkalitalea saponilacus]|uniref:D-citramalate synthase n=1 Tax=Alkalitalea saponilacus TaxID=889453 RepID=A0A1T5HT65_9BACT|nr:alpha-isopropylmalate synthase regulatory domain-containing protein [Alkalitalea saponilacus]ASB48964.1 2-isopropylmalate synthase [Alkalitalea saponilacus]SKC23889.1 D-citramalate synthase [Alkalitalea saponilacus]